MIFTELNEQLCQFPLLRILVFLIFLSLLVEIFNLYIYPWIRADVEDEIATLVKLNALAEKSLQDEKRQEQELLLQRQKLEKIDVNITLWREKCSVKKTLNLNEQKSLQESLLQKNLVINANLDALKEKQIFATECLKTINTAEKHQSKDSLHLLDELLKRLRG